MHDAARSPPWLVELASFRGAGRVLCVGEAGGSWSMTVVHSGLSASEAQGDCSMQNGRHKDAHSDATEKERFQI